MTHIISTALAAGAQNFCAEPAEHSLPGMGSIAQQPVFRPVLRRDIMAAVNICRRDLGLRQGALVVLDALLSCLPCKAADGKDHPVSPATLLTIYASNDTLCFRARGLTDRQLRRHLDTLEKADLIRRRDSANGKRFPIMRHGTPIGAFGLDLSPLFARAEGLLSLATQRRDEAQELRGIKAQIMRLRTACAEFQLEDTIHAFVDGLRNLLRRTSLTLVEARAALSKLTTILTAHDASARNDQKGRGPVDSLTPPTSARDLSTEINLTDAGRNQHSPQTLPLHPHQTSACDGHFDRHIEQESDTKKTKDRNHQKWSDLTEISTFFSEPENAQDVATIAFDFGRMLRISQGLLVTASTKLGLWELLKLEDRMAKQICTIQNPDAYMRSVLQR